MQQTSTAPERRAADRFGLALPITMEGEECASHDLSATGVLVETRSAPAVGADVDLSLEYVAQGRTFSLACRGEVVRIERNASGFNIAVRLHDPLFHDEP